MRRWFSRDSNKLKIGVVALLLVVASTVAGSLSTIDESAVLTQKANVAQAAPQQMALDEKPRIAVTKTEVVTTEEEVPFATTQTYDGTLLKDTTVVRVDGHAGKKVIRTEVKTKDGLEISRALISEDITVPPVARVVAIGTKAAAPKQAAKLSSDCDSHYQPCVRNSSKDLDCADIGFRVQVVAIGSDPHGFDRDNDGIGCESYPQQSADL